MKLRQAGFVLVLVALASQSPAQEAKPKSAGEAVDRLGLRFTPNAELVITADLAEGMKTDQLIDEILKTLAEAKPSDKAEKKGAAVGAA